MLNEEQRREFSESGILRLPQFAESLAVARLREEVLAFVESHESGKERQFGYAVNPSKLARFTKKLGFIEVWSERVTALVDALLGAGTWHLPGHAGQILAMTYPTQGVTWSVPHRMWHLDYQAPGAADRIPGLQLFACLDRVEPESGATLVAAGTPVLID